jgi:GT2 family glycosyltransferase
LKPVTLIVLAWNGWDLTRRALDGLLATSLDTSQVIVVDNGSTDATAAGLRDYAARVRVLRLPENLGFVRGNNAGIAAAAPGSDIVLLNNDLEFPQPDWLQRLRACAGERSRTGIVGCRLSDGEGHLLHAGTRVMADDCCGVQLASGRVERDIGQYAGRDPVVQGVVFAAVYIRREVIEAIGALHLDYDTYFEDSDYCLRAAAAGFDTVLCGGVTLVHRQHGSTLRDDARRQRLWSAGQSTFSRHWRDSLRAKYRRALTWQSSLDFPPRYAELSRGLLPTLDRVGIDVRYGSLYADAPAALRESGDSHHHVLNTLRARGEFFAPDIVVACGEAALFHHARGNYRVGYGTFAHPAELDAATIAAWNAMDEAWVHSAWHGQVLRETGLQRPIQVMPQGIDVDYFHPRLQRLENPHGEFVFLLGAAWDELEQPWRVIDVFVRAFRRGEAVRLVAWLDGAGVDLAAEIRKLGLDPHGGRVSFLLDRDLPAYERGLVYRAADAFIAMPVGASAEPRLLEAMAVGLPVLAPAHPAWPDLICAAHGWPLVFDRDMNAEILRAVSADRGETQRRGMQASRFVTQTRCLERAAENVLQRCEAWALEGAVGKPRAPLRKSPLEIPQACVIVLGMHRSGTSCVAGALQAMGLYGGEPDEFLANPAENPYGFFERADLHAACLTALAQRGGDWSIPLGWSDAEAAAASVVLRADFRAILAALDRRGGWFVKEPRLCLLAPEILDLVVTPLHVHVVRDPRAVARSIARRDGLSVPHALALWEHYQLQILRAAKPAALRIDYETLQRAPAAELAQLHNGLRERGATGMRRLQAAECAAWVRPEFDRAGAGEAIHLPPPIKALWRDLVARKHFDDVPALSTESQDLLQRLYHEHQTVRAQRHGTGQA